MKRLVDGDVSVSGARVYGEVKGESDDKIHVGCRCEIRCWFPHGERDYMQARS
jgi:hypothetical protein